MILYYLISKIDKLLQNVVSSYYKTKYNLPSTTIIRNGKLKLSGQFKCGDNCRFEGDIIINAVAPVELGRYTVINGPNTDIFSSVNPVKIGSFCSIARSVSIQEFNHDFKYFTSSFIEKNMMELPNNSLCSKGPITIGNDVWIGAQCLILSGSTIGDGAVIAANSTVVGNIPPYSIVAGSPAKVIKYRFKPEIIKKIQDSKWWDHINSNNYFDYKEKLTKIINEDD